MQPGLGLVQQELCAARDDYTAVVQVVLHQVPDAAHAWDQLVAIRHQCHCVDIEGATQVSAFVQLIEHHIGISSLFELDDYAHALAVAFITQVRDALYLARFVHSSDLLQERRLADLIRQLCDQDSVAVTIQRLDTGAGLHDHPSMAGVVVFTDPLLPQYVARRWEIRAGHDAHELASR